MKKAECFVLNKMIGLLAHRIYIGMNNAITLLITLYLLTFSYGCNKNNEIDFEYMNDKPVIN